MPPTNTHTCTHARTHTSCVKPETDATHKVIFERHAVGGEYSAGYNAHVGRGTLKTVFYPEVHEPGNPDFPSYKVIYETPLTDGDNAVVTYHNPLDNVADLADIFFTRCLEAKVTPYVVTKKTVFKWQESFWEIHKRCGRRAHMRWRPRLRARGPPPEAPHSHRQLPTAPSAPAYAAARAHRKPRRHARRAHAAGGQQLARMQPPHIPDAARDRGGRDAGNDRDCQRC